MYRQMCRPVRVAGFPAGISVATFDQSGRELGPRALRTRQRLLESTESLLGQQSLRDLSVVEIARKAETSPATFYQYFKDVSAVTLVLAEQAAEEMPSVVELIDGSWEGESGLETARAVVDAFEEATTDVSIRTRDGLAN